MLQGSPALTKEGLVDCMIEWLFGVLTALLTAMRAGSKQLGLHRSSLLRTSQSRSGVLEVL